MSLIYLLYNPALSFIVFVLLFYNWKITTVSNKEGTLQLLTFIFQQSFFLKWWLYSFLFIFLLYRLWECLYHKRCLRSLDNLLGFFFLLLLLFLLILVFFTSCWLFLPVNTCIIYTRRAEICPLRAGVGRGGVTFRSRSLCVRITSSMLFIPKSLIRVYLYIFVQKPTSIQHFNDVKSPWRCHGETLPFEKCYFFRCRLSRYVNAYCKRGCVQLEISV